MEKKYIKLEDLPSYNIASSLSDFVWDAVSKWDWFSKKTIGAQFVDSIDSMAANIAEGFGRYHRKDKIKFYYNARASVYESSFWCKKAQIRKLLTIKDGEYILSELRKLPKAINILIKLTSSLER